MKCSPFLLLPFVALSVAGARADEATGVKAPPPMFLSTWTGFYAGVNAGGSWHGAAATPDWSRLSAVAVTNPAAFSSLPQASFAAPSGPAFMGGGQIGYNWQVTEKVVLGVEADFQGVAGGGSNWSVGGSAVPLGRTPASIGSVRGRAGYLVAPNLQVYGTGGLSYGATGQP